MGGRRFGADGLLGGDLPVYGERPDPINQGDIFRQVPFLDPPAGGASWGMVISHDCDVDKFLKPAKPLSTTARASWRITMAVVHPVDDLADDRAGHVRADRMPRYFFLQAEGDLPDLCADLWTEQSVRAEQLVGCPRVACLSPETRERLWWKMIRLRLGEHFKSILEGNVPPDAA
jgi:hypothetical protein